MKDEDLGLLVKELNKQAKSVATHMREKSGSREAGPLIVEKTPSDNEVKIKGLLKLVDYFKTENENIDTNVYDSVARQQVKTFGFRLPSSPELCEKVFLDGSRVMGLGMIQKSYEMKVQELLPKISEINEKASVTGFDPITNMYELPFYHPDIIIAKPDRNLEGKCGTVYKVFDRRMANGKGAIRALKINKEDTVSGTKKLTDGDLGVRTPHIVRREEKTDIISGEIGYSLDWFDYSLDDYLRDEEGNKKYFKNGLNIDTIDHLSKQFTKIMWEYHNIREELCLDGKPENIMIDPISPNDCPDLVYSDTGISTPIDRGKSKASRNSVGTEYIRSPKLFRDSADSDVKDDLFSVASNIYNLFTGEFLFQEEIDGERDLKNGSLDTFIDSLLDERKINRKVIDSVLTKKFKGKKIPKQYQEVIRAGALGDYENAEGLMDALIDAKEKYDVRISKYGKWGMASGIGGLAMAGLLAINTLMSNYDVTGNLGRTLANFNNFSKVENINPRNLTNDKIHLDKLLGNNKFLMIAESDYSNPSNEELDSLKQDIRNARFGKSIQITKPWSLVLGNAGIYQTSGEKKTTTEFVVDHFKNTKEGNTVQNTIIYSVLNSLKNLDLSMEMDFFPNDTLVTTSWFKNSIDDCLNENYGLSTEDYPTAKAKNLDKIRDYFTLNLARNYDEEIGKIDMENFVVELLLGYKRLNEARDISGKTDFIGYTNSVKNNEILPKKSKEQIEFSKKYQDKMDANIKYFKQNSDSLKELSMRDRLFYALIMNQDEKREINNIFIKSIKSTTKINRYGAIPGKEILPIITERAILPGMKSRGSIYTAGTTIPTFSTTDRIAMQYVLHNLQNDLGQEMIPYLPGQENSLEVLGNSISSILEGMENGGVPDAQSIPEGFIKMAESVKINMKTFGLLLNQDNFESTQYTVNPNYIKMFELYSQLINNPEITKNDKFRKEYQKIQNNLNN